MAAFDFTGRKVIVAGGSSGIGNGIAQAFRACGAEVTITGTRPPETYAGEPGSDFAGLSFAQLDIGIDAQVAAFAQAWDGPLHVLVNASGTVAYRRKEFEIETFRRILDVNLTGVFHLCTLFHPKLKDTGGSIVNVTSLAAFNATKNNPAYSASKGGLGILTKTLADHWGRDGVRVNAVAPGFVESKLTKVSRDNPAIYQGSIAKTPLGRWGTPADMAGAALWLASEYASFVTGQSIVVDGGISLG
jgi:3-oxoacyl-[acyl-carrier protein] reductase